MDVLRWESVKSVKVLRAYSAIILRATEMYLES